MYLADGSYELKGNQAEGLTIIGVGDSVKLSNLTNYAGNGSFGSIWRKMTFENVTFTDTVYTQNDGGNSTFTNVVFEKGFRRGYGSGVVFNNCTFGSNSEGYALHFETDAESEGGVIQLNNCTFQGGKVHLGSQRTYVFTECEFAIGTDFQVWSDVTLDDCTVNGVKVTAENITTVFPNLDMTKVTLATE